MSRIKVFFLAGVLLLVAAAVYWVLFADKVFTVVEGRIYRSAQLSGKGLEDFLRSKGIKTVLNLRGVTNHKEWYTRERDTAERYGVRLISVGLSPRELPDYPKLLEVVKVLREAERPILIHCYHGADRSGLASALALAIEQDMPLPELKKQVSWRYGVFPLYRSTGPAFFSKYEDWLESTRRTHNGRNLIYWIENEYYDDKANLTFALDRVNGAECTPKTPVPDGSGGIVIEGWTYDSRLRAPVDGLYVSIDGKTAARMHPRSNRPDVAQSFGLGDEHSENFVVGWSVEFARGTLAKGCHDVFIRRVKSASETIEVPTNCGFCL